MEQPELLVQLEPTLALLQLESPDLLAGLAAVVQLEVLAQPERQQVLAQLARVVALGPQGTLVPLAILPGCTTAFRHIP